jgi:hypothetical protein
MGVDLGGALEPRLLFSSRKLHEALYGEGEPDGGDPGAMEQQAQVGMGRAVAVVMV